MNVFGGEQVNTTSNWGEENYQNMNIQTIHGEQSQQHRVLQVKLVTLEGIVDVTAIEGHWQNGETEFQISPEEAEEWQVDPPATEIAQLPRLILSAGHLLLHPKIHVKKTEQLQKVQPYLGIFKSPVTGRLLCAGRRTSGPQD